MVLTGILWVGSRVVGNLIGTLITYNRWIIALATYMVFYYIISRIEDKYDFDIDKAWEKRN